jgi:hypothetical protein
MTTRPGYVWDDNTSEWVEIGQAAVVAPISYQASAPSTPSTGDIWIDSDDEVPSVDSTLYYRWTKTMSGGETSLSGTDDNSLSLQYTPGYESVFINGVLQVRNLDYTATSGSTISGLTALASNDVVMVESIIAYSVGDTYTQTQIGSLLDAKSPVSTTGLVLISSTTIGSAVSSVTISNCFSATYENYKVILVGGVSSTDGYINCQLATDSTPVANNYYLGRFGIEFNSSGSGNANQNNTASWTYSGYGNTDWNHAEVDLRMPFLAKKTLMSGVYTATTTFGAINVGLHNVATSYNSIHFSRASGTMTGGTIKVYGYK